MKVAVTVVGRDERELDERWVAQVPLKLVLGEIAWMTMTTTMMMTMMTMMEMGEGEDEDERVGDKSSLRGLRDAANVRVAELHIAARR